MDVISLSTTTTTSEDSRVPDIRLRCGRRAAAALVAAALCAGLTALPPASADPVYPSQEEVDAARGAASAAAGSVAQIEAQLVAAADALDAAQVAAQVAVEDWNEAEVALEKASAAATSTQQASDEAQQQLVVARSEVGALAAQSYRGGGGLGELEALLTDAGPQDLIDRTATLDYLGQGRQRTLAHGQSTELVAAGLREQAADARSARQAAADAAEAARQRAEDAQAAAEAQVATTETTRTRLVAQLAALQGTTVQLEQQRQAGLEAERIAREEAAARAAAAAREAEERRAADAAAATQRRAAADQASRDRTPAAPAPANPAPANPAPAPANPAPAPAPPAPAPGPPSTGGSSGSSSGAQSAIDFALGQLGKPYLWGGIGPGSYDCSGLTMQSWRRGGVNLPRTSRDQYRAVEKIPYSQLRPGDLIFYGDGGNASSIYHVAMFIGGGQMVEAPRAGVPVRVTSLRMSGTMDYAGRP